MEFGYTNFFFFLKKKGKILALKADKLSLNINITYRCKMSICTNKMELIFNFEDISAKMYLIMQTQITDTYVYLCLVVVTVC